MFEILPSDAILNNCGGTPSRHYDYCEWWMAYEWFCRRLIEWPTQSLDYELLNATSGRGHNDFDSIWNIKVPCKRLGYLFMEGWYHPQAESFLDYLGLKKWENFAKPIRIAHWRPKNFPCTSWFEMRGRTLNYSPNDCHPEAKWVTGFCLQFSAYRKRWNANINYGYLHNDGSTWAVSMEQKYGESLDSFGKRIQIWIDAILIPDTNPIERVLVEEFREQIYDAIGKLFYDGSYTAKNLIADILTTNSTRNNEIILNSQRLATLKRWAEETVKQDKE